MSVPNIKLSLVSQNYNVKKQDKDTDKNTHKKTLYSYCFIIPLFFQDSSNGIRNKNMGNLPVSL